MITWIRSLFAWRTAFSTGAWDYCENSVTGQRKAFWLRGGYCPLVQGWLRAGDIVVGPHGTTIIGNR